MEIAPIKRLCVFDSTINCKVEILQDRKIKEIADAGLSEIMVSVHGHNSFIHDMNTRSIGSFELTMRGLSYIREIGLYTLTNTVVTNYNVDYLDEIVEKLAFEYGVEEMAFSFPRIEGSVKKNLDCIPPFEVASIALERVLNRLNQAVNHVKGLSVKQKVII